MQTGSREEVKVAGWGGWRDAEGEWGRSEGGGVGRVEKWRRVSGEVGRVRGEGGGGEEGRRRGRDGHAHYLFFSPSLYSGIPAISPATL